MYRGRRDRAQVVEQGERHFPFAGSQDDYRWLIGSCVYEEGSSDAVERHTATSSTMLMSMLHSECEFLKMILPRLDVVPSWTATHIRELSQWRTSSERMMQTSDGIEKKGGRVMHRI